MCKAPSSGRSTSSMRSSSSRSHEPVLSKLFRMSCAWKRPIERNRDGELHYIFHKNTTVVIHSHRLWKDDHIKERGYTDTGSETWIENIHWTWSVYKTVDFSGHLIIWKCKSMPRWKSIHLNKTSIWPQPEMSSFIFCLCGRRKRGQLSAIEALFNAF